MGNWPESLVCTLKRECDLLFLLTGVSESRKRAVVNGDVSVLNSILNEEQPLLMELAQAEKKRTEILKRAGLEGVTLSEAAEKAGENGEALKNLLKTLSKAADDYKNINELNDVLIKSRLEFYRALEGGRGGGYGRSGLKRRELSGLMDKKA